MDNESTSSNGQHSTQSNPNSTTNVNSSPTNPNPNPNSNPNDSPTNNNQSCSVPELIVDKGDDTGMNHDHDEVPEEGDFNNEVSMIQALYTDLYLALYVSDIWL